MIHNMIAKMHNPSYKMHSYSTFNGSNTHISTFNMFIIIHGTINIIAELKQSGLLIF